MSGLFERLADVKAKLLGKPAADVPIPFEVVCECGHRVAGIRRRSYQVAECSECTASIFVLPVDPYPAVRKAVPKEAPPTRRVTPSTSTVQADTETAVHGRSGGSPEPVPQRSGKSDDRSEVGKAPEQVLPDEDVIRLPPKPPLAVRLRRTFSPVRLLAVAGMALVGLTAWWMIHQRTLDEARRTWRREIDIVRKAIEEGDRISLSTAIKKAVDAAALLSRDDADARDARSLLRQTQALEQVGQSASDPVSVLSDVTPAKVQDTDDLKEVLGRLEGICCVFESPLIRSPENDRILIVNAPLLTPSGRIRIQVDSQLLRGLFDQFGQDSVLFVASVTKASRDASGAGEWLINLDGRSVTLLTSELLAAELGHDPKHIPETAEILKRQEEYMRSDAAQKPEPEAEQKADAK